MTDELRRLFGEVAAAPPPPSNLGPAIRQTTGGRLRWAMITALVLLVAVGIYAVATAGSGRRTVALRTAPVPTATRTPAPTRRPAPLPTPGTASLPPTAPPATSAPPVVQPTPSTAAPAPRPTSHRPTPTRSPSPSPAPTYARPGASVSFTTSSSPASGHQVTFTVTVKDNDGYLLSGTLDFGDGSQIPLGQGAVTCGSSSGYAPEPSSTTKTFVHTYSGTGVVQAQAMATTGSTCRATPREDVSAYGTVNVP